VRNETFRLTIPSPSCISVKDPSVLEKSKFACILRVRSTRDPGCKGISFCSSCVSQVTRHVPESPETTKVECKEFLLVFITHPQNELDMEITFLQVNLHIYTAQALGSGPKTASLFFLIPKVILTKTVERVARFLAKYSILSMKRPKVSDARTSAIAHPPTMPQPQQIKFHLSSTFKTKISITHHIASYLCPSRSIKWILKLLDTNRGLCRWQCGTCFAAGCRSRRALCSPLAVFRYSRAVQTPSGSPHWIDAPLRCSTHHPMYWGLSDLNTFTHSKHKHQQIILRTL